jgi:signal transduction histidine kinase
MKDKMKKYVLAFAIFVLLISALAAVTAGSDGTDVKKIEDRLPQSSGEERIELLVELSEYYMDRDAKKVLTYGMEALELLRNFTNPNRQVILYNYISHAHSTLSHHEKARKYVKLAQELAEKTGDKKGYADALNNRATISFNQGDYDLSIQHLSRALDIYEKLENREGMARVFKSIGNTYYKVGDLSSSLENYLKAAEIYDKEGNKERIASIYNNIANVCKRRGDIENTLVYYNKSLEIYKEIRHKRGMSGVLHNISYLHFGQGKFKEALAYGKQSLKIREELGARKNIAHNMVLIGVIYAAQDKHQPALQYLTKALEMAREINEREFVAGILIRIGEIKRKSGQYREALSLLEQALDITVEIKVKDDERDAARELYETCKAIKNYQKALEYHQKYKELSDSILNEKNSKKMAELQARYDFERKEQEIQLLKKNEEIQQLKLKRQKTFTYSFILISLLVLLVAVLIYTRYRLKERANRALKKEMEDRKKAEAELVRSQKMEAVGILAGGIAHDFNNLLTVITGYLYMIKEKEKVKKDQSIFKMVNSVERASKQAVALANKFITFAKGGWMAPQKLHFKDILANTIDRHPELEPLPGNISIPPVLHPVYGDERQLAEVMFNLLKNADEAMTEPKQVIIKAENITLDKKNSYSLEEGDYLKISISDNGRGIPVDQLDKIFEPYFSTKDTYAQKGRGLGLAICYSVIKRHNGHIAVQSLVGVGTTAELYLPAFHKSNSSS